MQLKSGILAALLLGLAVGPISAQTRTITGRVTDSISGGPVEGARIGLLGGVTAVGATGTGQFSLPNVPAGDVTLLVRAVGYRRREVRVPAGASTVDVALDRDVFKIEEIVVTGQATSVERRNLPNAVASVGADDIGAVPQTTASIEQVLQGKVAGVDIQSNSGAPGGGLQVRLRGVTSVNADAQPLYIVDGVIMADVAIPSNQNAVTAAAGGSNPALTQDGQVNRIADLNPGDIETIEILKGASAAAIYGGRASNGVVIITTKRGVPGATRVSVSQRFGTFVQSKKLGSRRFNNITDVDTTYSAGVGAANGCTANSCPFFDHEEELAGRKKLSTQTAVTVSGGTDNTRFLVSGLVQNDEGIIENSGFQRQSVRFNLDQRIGDKLQANLRSNIVHTKAQRGLTNNDNTGTSYYVALAFTPSFAPLQKGPDGIFPANGFNASNPLQTAALSRNDEDVWRFTMGSDLTWNIKSGERNSLRAVLSGGADFFIQKNPLFFPPELQFEPQDGFPGTSLLSNSSNLNLNLGTNLVHTFNGSGFSATTSAGWQYARRDLDISRTISKGLIAGQPNVNSGTSIQVNQARQEIANLGGFLQEELLLMDRKLLLNAGIRGDRSSLNANSHKYHLYPKAAASYLLAREGSGMFNELKLRAAYGESGNEPLYGQKFTPLTATGNIGGIPGLTVGATTGSATLKPERQREIEIGTDGQLWGSRLSFEATVYQKTISDLLITRTLAPSSGIVSEIFNGGKLRTRGVELGVGIVPVQSRSVNWYFRTNFSTNKSEITELPVPPFETGGFGTSLGAFRIELGKSATQIVGVDTLPHAAGTARPDTVVAIGDANPDFRMSFINDISWKNLTFHVLADWQQGSEILNLTRLLYDFGGVTEDYADPVPGSTLAAGPKRLAGFQLVAANYVEKATFFKLREVSVSWEMPSSMVRSIWGAFSGGRLSLSGRNLFTATPYTGLDPEVSNFGNQAIARNIDVAPFPPSRSFFFTIDLRF
jgi:TonB-linked SusC/RagA family outer membrane protein